MTRTYWLATETADGARRLAHAIHAGVVPMLPHYESEAAAMAWAEKYGRLTRTPSRVRSITIRDVAERIAA